MDRISNETLIDMAKKVKANAYAPYSGFWVGAALMTEDGTVFTGCNVENSSYGATICAERSAMVKAVSEGYHHFIKIAIVGGDEREYTFPCGMCLQVMSEFMDKDASLIFLSIEGIKEFTLEEFLPNQFILS